MDKQLFGSAARKVPPTTTLNHEGAPAYALGSKEALAQLAATGCFGDTFYVSGKEQLDKVLKMARECEPEFVAKVAVYSRQRGYMKDMPALLTAYLSTVDTELMRKAFVQTIDNGKMLRNFVQVMRSGVLGRKSLGTAPRKAVQKWLQGRTPMQLFRDSVGNNPSLVDVIKMVHPKLDDERNVVVRYLLGKPEVSGLPTPVLAFESWKKGNGGPVPRIPSRMLQGLPLTPEAWKEIARNARWMETRMSLNTFERHGVFKDPELVQLIAKRLADPEEVRGARAFPYQLLMAYMQTSGVPTEVREALQDAMEIAIENTPEIPGNVFVCPDVSGSMRGAITGSRYGATTAVQCVHVAGLITAAILRKNKHARVLPFERRLYTGDINPRDSVMSIAEEMSRIGGGGTNCSLPLAHLNQQSTKVDAVIFVSDYESWLDGGGYRGFGSSYGQGAGMQSEWQRLKGRNKNAKLICIDLTPQTTAQVTTQTDVLQVGGFSDAVFDIVADFLKSGDRKGRWLDSIEGIEL